MLLAIQGQMVGIFADDNLCDDRWLNSTFRKDMCRHFSAEHFLTAGTAVLRADIAVDHDLCRNIFQLLADFIANEVQGGITVRTTFLSWRDNLFSTGKR